LGTTPGRLPLSFPSLRLLSYPARGTQCTTYACTTPQHCYGLDLRASTHHTVRHMQFLQFHCLSALLQFSAGVLIPPKSTTISWCSSDKSCWFPCTQQTQQPSVCTPATPATGADYTARVFGILRPRSRSPQHEIVIRLLVI